MTLVKALCLSLFMICLAARGQESAPLRQVLAHIEQVIAASSAGASGMHDLRTRHAGHTTFIEFHLTVDGRMSVSESHDICDRIEDALEAAVDGARVTIHVEPDA